MLVRDTDFSVRNLDVSISFQQNGFLSGSLYTFGKTKMFGFRQFLVVFSLMSVVTPGTLDRPVKCNPGMYYDTAIGRCDVCDVICDYAEIQGTVLECNDKCPGYKSTTISNLSVSTSSLPGSPSGDMNRVTTSASSVTSSFGETSVKPRLVIFLVIALCVVTILMSTAIILLVVWKIRGDTSNQTTIHKRINRTPSPIYLNGQKKRIDGDYVLNGLLSRDFADV
ncbi:uncharacterized protein [Haliotis asinina]|uniref:uncharacterized protein n=1 Tax=Haliotis asinina TaxID=109174 RepID=UPI00353218AE